MTKQSNHNDPESTWKTSLTLRVNLDSYLAGLSNNEQPMELVTTLSQLLKDNPSLKDHQLVAVIQASEKYQTGIKLIEANRFLNFIRSDAVVGFRFRSRTYVFQNQMVLRAGMQMVSDHEPFSNREEAKLLIDHRRNQFLIAGFETPTLGQIGYRRVPTVQVMVCKEEGPARTFDWDIKDMIPKDVDAHSDYVFLDLRQKEVKLDWEQFFNSVAAAEKE